jgi:hypothetical protein
VGSYLRRDRAAMFDLAGRLDPATTSDDKNGPPEERSWTGRKNTTCAWR